MISFGKPIKIILAQMDEKFIIRDLLKCALHTLVIIIIIIDKHNMDTTCMNDI